VLFSCATVRVAINATARNRISDENVFRMFMPRLCSRQGSQVKTNYFARGVKKETGEPRSRLPAQNLGKYQRRYNRGVGLDYELGCVDA
jgi:hypothetical protein